MLFGLSRTGLEPWLLERYPDAHWLIFSAHPVVDVSLIPLGVIFLAVLWFTGDSPRQSRLVQIVLALGCPSRAIAHPGVGLSPGDPGQAKSCNSKLKATA